MQKIATVFLVVLSLGIFSVPVAAEDMESIVAIGMVTDYNAGSSITVIDEYSGSNYTYSIAGDTLIDGDITIGSYVEIEAQGNTVVYIGVITREQDE